MPTTSKDEDGWERVDVAKRYRVEVTLLGSPVPMIFEHETEGAALARVTAILVKRPGAQLEEERRVVIGQPTSVVYRIRMGVTLDGGL